jgi:hypothetical protein
VDAWGQALRDRASQTHQDYLESLTRWEPCAYPGCTNKIKVVTYQHGIGQRESPEPVRKMRVWYQTAGWHRELGSKDLVPNSETMSKSLYACSPAHTEGVFRLVVGLTLTLDEAGEKRLLAIRYPVAVSQQARIEVADLAASTALSYVAQIKLGETPETSRAHIKALAHAQLAHVLDGAGDHFTDDLSKFQKIYLRTFTMGYTSGLKVRQYIVEGSQSYRSDARWHDLYAALSKL